MHPDVEHHQEDPELAEDLYRLVALQDPEQRWPEQDPRCDLAEDRRIAEADRHPATDEGGTEHQGEHQYLLVHQPNSCLSFTRGNGGMCIGSGDAHDAFRRRGFRSGSSGRVGHKGHQ
jgi:hypothetical protein